jgi:pimeloyl-ACP methyl ester carboxylesterase
MRRPIRLMQGVVWIAQLDAGLRAGLFRELPHASLTQRATDLDRRRDEQPAEGEHMGTESRPNSDYTRTWSPSGEVEYATLADGTRLRYLRAGSGPALILLHTVRTQLDHFQLVIPKLVDAFTVFAIDMPGMGWSDITAGASYDEPALRRAMVEFVKTLDLDEVTLAGESMGATVSLTASTELEGRVRRIVAFNTYDYPEASVEPMVSPRSTSAVHACRQSVRWSRRWRTSRPSAWYCGAVWSTGASCPITTSPSCVGSAVVAATRAWRARFTAMWTA